METEEEIPLSISVRDFTLSHLATTLFKNKIDSTPSKTLMCPFDSLFRRSGLLIEPNSIKELDAVCVTKQG